MDLVNFQITKSLPAKSYICDFGNEVNCLKTMICLQEMELERQLIGNTAQRPDLVQTKRGTMTAITNASKTMSVEKITAEISGTRQNQQLTAAFQVT